MQTAHLKVTGMTCGGCVNNVTLALTNVKGVQEVTVALSEGRVSVLYDEKFTDQMHLKSTIQTAGYGVDSAPVDATPKSKSCCG